MRIIEITLAMYIAVCPPPKSRKPHGVPPRSTTVFRSPNIFYWSSVDKQEWPTLNIFNQSCVGLEHSLSEGWETNNIKHDLVWRINQWLCRQNNNSWANQKRLAREQEREKIIGQIERENTRQTFMERQWRSTAVVKAQLASDMFSLV